MGCQLLFHGLPPDDILEDSMLLLFDAKHRYLGEVTLSDNGALLSIFLTVKGDEEIGPTVAMWQTKGIPVRQNVNGTAQLNETFFVERIQPRAPGFKHAVLAWARESKIAVIDLEDKLMQYWETLLRLPLTESERFAYLIGVCRTSEQKLQEWETLFEKLRNHDGAEGRRALSKLKVKLAKEMTNSFCDVSGVSH